MTDIMMDLPEQLTHRLIRQGNMDMKVHCDIRNKVYPTPYGTYQLVLEQLGFAYHQTLQSYAEHYKDVYLRPIYESDYWKAGKFIGVSIKTDVYSNYRRIKGSQFKVMVKANKINLSLIRQRIEELPALKDSDKAEREAERIRYEAKKEMVYSLNHKLSELHGNDLDYYNAKYNVERYDPTTLLGRKGFEMKLQNLTEEQVLFIADIVKAWNTL